MAVKAPPLLAGRRRKHASRKQTDRPGSAEIGRLTATVSAALSRRSRSACRREAGVRHRSRRRNRDCNGQPGSIMLGDVGVSAVEDLADRLQAVLLERLPDLELDRTVALAAGLPAGEAHTHDDGVDLVHHALDDLRRQSGLYSRRFGSARRRAGRAAATRARLRPRRPRRRRPGRRPARGRGTRRPQSDSVTQRSCVLLMSLTRLLTSRKQGLIRCRSSLIQARCHGGHTRPSL
jgi:hypothetical protein